MQHGEEHRAFYYEAMAALARKTRVLICTEN
jgi:hypothetical protein